MTPILMLQTDGDRAHWSAFWVNTPEFAESIVAEDGRIMIIEPDMVMWDEIAALAGSQHFDA